MLRRVATCHNCQMWAAEGEGAGTAKGLLAHLGTAEVGQLQEHSVSASWRQLHIHQQEMKSSVWGWAKE